MATDPDLPPIADFVPLVLRELDPSGGRRRHRDPTFGRWGCLRTDAASRSHWPRTLALHPKLAPLSGEFTPQLGGRSCCRTIRGCTRWSCVGRGGQRPSHLLPVPPGRVLFIGHHS